MRPAQEVFFDSDGVGCAADMYWPDDADGSVPCVVMAHGGSGTKSSHTATCIANSLSAMMSSSQRERSLRSRWSLECTGIEMPYRSAKITHTARCADDLAVDWPEVEPPKGTRTPAHSCINTA